MFSIGIIFFLLIFKSSPFLQYPGEQLIEANERGEINYEQEYWKNKKQDHLSKNFKLRNRLIEEHAVEGSQLEIASLEGDEPQMVHQNEK